MAYCVTCTTHLSRKVTPAEDRGGRVASCPQVDDVGEAAPSRDGAGEHVGGVVIGGLHRKEVVPDRDLAGGRRGVELGGRDVEVLRKREERGERSEGVT